MSTSSRVIKNTGYLYAKMAITVFISLYVTRLILDSLTAVVGRLADYIKRNKPELRGYGKSNLYNMALLYDTFSSEAFLGIIERHKSILAKSINFFQMPSGKSLDKPSDKSSDSCCCNSK